MRIAPQLGLTSVEVHIMRALTSHATNLSESELARLCGLPRTTIAYRLRKLNRRKLVTSVRAGKERQWSAESAQPTFTQSKAEVRHGFDALVSTFKLLFRDTSHHRVYAIEPAHALRTYVSKLKEKDAQIILAHFKNKRHVAEVVTAQSALLQLQKLSPRTRKEMFGRAMQVTSVPDKYLPFREYIVIRNDTTYFLDPTKETVRILNDAALARTFKEVVEVLKHLGSPVDFNSQIAASR